MQADLATRQDEVQHNIESLPADRTKNRDEMQELVQTLQVKQASAQGELQAALGAFQTKQTADHKAWQDACTQLESQLNEAWHNLCSQLGTQLSSLSYSFDTKVLDTQDRLKQAGDAFVLQAEKWEKDYGDLKTGFHSMQEDLQTRITKLDMSLGLIAETNRSLESKFHSLDGYLHITQMLARDERITHLETLTGELSKQIEDSVSRLESSGITRLENLTGELSKQIEDSVSRLESSMLDEIKASHEDVLARLEERLEEGDADSLQPETPPRRYVNSSKAVIHTPLVYPAVMVDKQHSRKPPHGQLTYTWQPTQLKDLRHIKESVVSYGLHSSYVKQLLHSWATHNRVTPADWVGLAAALLENARQIEWRARFREEAGFLEQNAAEHGVNTPLQKIIGEGIYADPQVQAEYDDHTLSLCRTAALNAWDKVRGLGEQLESYVKIEQGQSESFRDFLDRLTRAVDMQVVDPMARHSTLYTLAL